jgi:hypothetical protein
MVLAPNDLFSCNNKYNRYNEYNITDTFTCFFLAMHTTYSVHAGILKHEGVVFLDLLSSSHPITSSLFPCLGSTDAPCSRLGDPVPPSPKWRPIHRVRAHSLTGIRNMYGNCLVYPATVHAYRNSCGTYLKKPSVSTQNYF